MLDKKVHSLRFILRTILDFLCNNQSKPKLLHQNVRRSPPHRNCAQICTETFSGNCQLAPIHYTPRLLLNWLVSTFSLTWFFYPLHLRKYPCFSLFILPLLSHSACNSEPFVFLLLVKLLFIMTEVLKYLPVLH